MVGQKSTKALTKGSVRSAQTSLDDKSNPNLIGYPHAAAAAIPRGRARLPWHLRPAPLLYLGEGQRFQCFGIIIIMRDFWSLRLFRAISDVIR